MSSSAGPAPSPSGGPKAFGPGDAIFAPAGWVHRFEDLSPDFATWVVFWRPKGGEADA